MAYVVDANEVAVLFAAVAVPIYLLLIPSLDSQPGAPAKTRLAQLDYLETVLMIGACVSGVMAINFGGQIYPWDSAQTISCFAVSGVLFIAFGFQQWYCVWMTKENRAFPCQFLEHISFIAPFYLSRQHRSLLSSLSQFILSRYSSSFLEVSRPLTQASISYHFSASLSRPLSLTAP